MNPVIGPNHLPSLRDHKLLEDQRFKKHVRKIH